MNNKELTELKREEEMKPNDLNYLKLVRDMNDMLENDFCMDMDCKLHLHGGRDKNSFTQEEAQQMADLIGKLYTLSHYWYCHCGLGKGYELTKTTQSNDEIKREAYILGYKAGWGDDAVYKTNGELEKEAKESFDGNKSLLGLTQKENNEQ